MSREAVEAERGSLWQKADRGGHASARWQESRWYHGEARRWRLQRPRDRRVVRPVRKRARTDRMLSTGAEAQSGAGPGRRK